MTSQSFHSTFIANINDVHDTVTTFSDLFIPQQGEKSTFTLIKINKSTEASKIYKYIKYKFNVTWLINNLYILNLLYEDFMFTSQY